MKPWLSIVIPTAGQRTSGLVRTLQSIDRQPHAEDVEVLIVADTHGVSERYPFSNLRSAITEFFDCHWLEYDGGLHCFGQPQRNYGARQALGDWVGFSQDDNILAEGALDAVWAAVSLSPPRPLFFRVLTPWREEVWAEPRLWQGNIDADCLVLPRELAQRVTWGARYEGDFDAALDAMVLTGGNVGWREERIAIARPEQEHIWWE